MLDARFGYLDALPPALFDVTFELAAGTLEQRALCVVAWRESLLAGQLPSSQPAEWQPHALVDGTIKELRALDLPRFCAGQEDVADEVLANVLETWREGDTVIASRRAEKLRELQRVLGALSEARHKKRHRDRGARPAGERRFHEEIERELAELGERTTRERLRSAWAERVAVWAEIEEAFGPLGSMLGLGWDLARAVVQSTGWREVERLRRLLAAVPELGEVVRTLGRMQSTEDQHSPPIIEQIIAPMRRAFEELREVTVPEVPHDVRGVDRSGSIERMLPSEAALLSHPTFRLLWHVRRAERSLLGYRVEGVYAERVTTEGNGEEVRHIERRPAVRGPMIICLDTSGSMAGTPEHVAKALTLETARVAHAEKRACFVYAFSGPGDLSELEVRLDAGGLASLVAFLQTSFHGGTDVAGPLRRAIARTAEATWDRADLLLVTDGEFPSDASLERDVVAACEARGARLHGVLVGSSSSAAMSRLCDPLHRFASWQVASLLGE